jgi:hypothetical protein
MLCSYKYGFLNSSDWIIETKHTFFLGTVSNTETLKSFYIYCFILTWKFQDLIFFFLGFKLLYFFVLVYCMYLLFCSKTSLIWDSDLARSTRSESEEVKYRSQVLFIQFHVCKAKIFKARVQDSLVENNRVLQLLLWKIKWCDLPILVVLIDVYLFGSKTNTFFKQILYTITFAVFTK